MSTQNRGTRLEYAQWLLERNLAWIAQAEVKVAVVVSIDIGMVSAVAAAYTAAQTRSAWAIGLSVLFGLLIIAGLGCAAVVVKPNTKGPKTSFVFFARVAEMGIADYVHAVKKATDDELLSDLAEQVHRNAEIALAKHHWVRLAFLWSFLAGAAWIAAISQLVK